MMARNKAYRAAELKIEEALGSAEKAFVLRGRFDEAGSKLTELPESIGKLTELKSLILSRNQLETLPESIGQLKKLESLTISSNQLTVLPESLGELTRLKSLDISRNQLTALPEWIGRLVRLESLIISNNQLTSLPNSINSLPNLRVLNLSENPSIVLPDSLDQLAQLKSLKLAGSLRITIPECLSKLKQLESLDLSRNQLTTVPEWIGTLTKLRDLDLFGNHLMTMPESVGLLTQLEVLRLSENQLTILPQSLGHLVQMRSMSLSHNQLTSLPDSFGELRNLRYLMMENNRLGEIPESIRRLRLLVDLRLSGNLLLALPDWIGELSQLELLEVASNQLTNLPESVGDLIELRDLYLGLQEAGSGNPLGEMPECVRSLQNLKVLWFQDCGLKSLPVWIGELGALESLHLGYNPISELPDTLGMLNCLDQFDLEGAPLNPELAAAYEGGFADVKRYLRELAKGGRERYEAKLLILGDGNEGKTCVSRALRGLPFREQSTTYGVDVEQWKFSHPDEKIGVESEVTLNIWDFEGQEISHQTHQFFLTSQALYLLVFKCRDQFLMDRAEYWLDTIRARAPKAKVAIVISQCESRSPHVPQDRIVAQYGDMLAEEWFFPVGCENGKNVERLQTFLQRSAADLEFMGAHWPRSYETAETEIKKRASVEISYLRREALNEILLNAGISEDNLKGAAGAMARIGAITHFPDSPDLADFIVLKPQWLTKAISELMEDGKLSEDKGEIEMARMDSIWSSGGHQGMFPIFHDCMKEFELCYDLEHSGHCCLVPLRFGYVAPPIPWLKQGGLKERRMEYKLNIRPPMGIMSRFIVKTHHMIVKTPDHPKGIYWYNGVFLRTMSPVPSEALCEFVPDERIFRVWVRAAFPQNMCEQIHGYIQAVFSFFGGLLPERSYGCIKVNDETGVEEQCTGLHTEKRIYTAISKQRKIMDCEFENHEIDPRALVWNMNSFGDFVADRLSSAQIAAIVRHEMDKTPEWAEPFLNGMQRLFEWVQYNSTQLDQVFQGQASLSEEFKQEAELKLYEYLRCVSEMLDDRDFTAAPALMSITTLDRSKWNPAGYFKKTYKLTPYCECEGNIHACEDGSVEFTKGRAWWDRSAPWIVRSTRLLAAGLQLAYAGMPLALGSDVAKTVENEIKLMEALTKHLELDAPETEDNEASAEVIQGGVGRDLRGCNRETALARASLAKLLEEIAPSNYRAKTWGSLRRVRMPDNTYRWLCETCEARGH